MFTFVHTHTHIHTHAQTVFFSPFEKKTDSELAKIFRGRNKAKENLYLQKFVMGNETVAHVTLMTVSNICTIVSRLPTNIYGRMNNGGGSQTVQEVCSKGVNRKFFPPRIE